MKFEYILNKLFDDYNLLRELKQYYTDDILIVNNTLYINSLYFSEYLWNVTAWCYHNNILYIIFPQNILYLHKLRPVGYDFSTRVSIGIVKSIAADDKYVYIAIGGFIDIYEIENLSLNYNIKLTTNETIISMLAHSGMLYISTDKFILFNQQTVTLDFCVSSTTFTTLY